MVDKISPSYPIVPSGSVSKSRDQLPQGVEAESDDKYSTPEELRYSKVERRSGADRRQAKQRRPVYDMRSNKGRRESDRDYPSIETHA